MKKERVMNLEVQVTTNRDGERQITVSNPNNPVEHVNHPLSWAGCDESDSEDEIIAEAKMLLRDSEA